MSEKEQSRLRSADRLVAHFEQLILSGEMAEGTALPPEREIVQEYGVSRTVVREAVLALSNKGLIRARPGFRPLVAKPGYDSAIEVVSSLAGKLLSQKGGVRNLFDLRILMEASLVRDAALSASKDDLVRMQAALAANKAAIDDSQEFYKTDTAFHGMLYEVSGNPLLEAVHKAYTDWLSPQWSRMPRQPDRNRRNYEAHKLIYDAILMRDADAAETALRQHLDKAWQQVSETFEKT